VLDSGASLRWAPNPRTHPPPPPPPPVRAPAVLLGDAKKQTDALVAAVTKLCEEK
jgi:hypothetical protein